MAGPHAEIHYSVNLSLSVGLEVNAHKHKHLWNKITLLLSRENKRHSRNALEWHQGGNEQATGVWGRGFGGRILARPITVKVLSVHPVKSLQSVHPQPPAHPTSIAPLQFPPDPSILPKISGYHKCIVSLFWPWDPLNICWNRIKICCQFSLAERILQVRSFLTIRQLL